MEQTHASPLEQQRAPKARKVCCNDVNDCADFEFVRDCSHPVQQGEAAARLSALPVELVGQPSGVAGRQLEDTEPIRALTACLHMHAWEACSCSPHLQRHLQPHTQQSPVIILNLQRLDILDRRNSCRC
jgi:hypothetical protein